MSWILFVFKWFLLGNLHDITPATDSKAVVWNNPYKGSNLKLSLTRSHFEIVSSNAMISVLVRP